MGVREGGIYCFSISCQYKVNLYHFGIKYRLFKTVHNDFKGMCMEIKNMTTGLDKQKFSA